MKPYHKIETLFVRDMEGTKKLIQGQYREPIVEYIKDNAWVFTEKIDGTNIRVHWNGHTVIFGGRTDAASIPSHLVNALNNKFSGTVNEQIFEQKFGEIPVTLYGEGYGAKVQNGGGLYRKDVGFILFDVLINGIYLERWNIEDIAKSFDVSVVPIVFRGTVEQAVEYIKGKPKSVISEEEKEMEGIVGTPVVGIFDRSGNRVIVKVKVRDFSPLAYQP